MRATEKRKEKALGKQATRQFTVKNGGKQFCLTQDKHLFSNRFILIRKEKEIARRTGNSYSCVQQKFYAFMLLSGIFFLVYGKNFAACGLRDKNISRVSKQRFMFQANNSTFELSSSQYRRLAQE